MSDGGVIIASGPVIVENGRVLLVKYGDDPFWKFPGGEWEEDDADFESTARREVREELGLEIVIRAPLSPLLVRRSDGGAVVLIHYLADRRGEVVAGSHIKAWDWLPISALPSEVAPNIAPVIADYLKRFPSRV